MLKNKDTTDMVKTTWRIPKGLVKEFKHLATDRETTVTMLVVEAMNQYLHLQRNNEPFNFNNNLYKPNIDRFKKEEFVKLFKDLVLEKKKVPPMTTEFQRSLEDYLTLVKLYGSINWTSPKYEDKKELANKFWKLTLEGETRVATVKEAIREVREKTKILK